jgi:hypothetical protein
MRSDSRYTVSHGRNPAAAESETKMTAKTPIYMQDELDHANTVRERMVPQVEAARVMLAALEALRSQVISARAHPKWAHLSNEQTNMLSAYLLQAEKAIAQAEAAGIKTEG